MKFEVRLLQQATKNQQKSMKNRMFFETSILEAFWMNFGKPKSMILAIFSKKMEAKNKMILGRLKNRNWRPQKQTADEARRSVRIRGKEHRMGGMPLSQESEA